MQVTSRLRRDAAVYKLTPPRTGKRGRPRKKGERLPPLPAMAAASGWATVTYDQRDTQVARQVWSRRLLWYHVAKDTPLLLVVVRDPAGRQPDDFLITTDVGADLAWVAAHYAGRWSIEVTFRDTKQHLGGEDPQSWTPNPGKRRGPERAACPLTVDLDRRLAVVSRRLGRPPLLDPHPRYLHKTTPSFADALAALRRTLWSQRITRLWPDRPVPTKII